MKQTIGKIQRGFHSGQLRLRSGPGLVVIGRVSHLFHACFKSGTEKTEKHSMKTQILIAMFLLGVLLGGAAHADSRAGTGAMSDRDFETQLQQEKRDFEKYVKVRGRSSADQEQSAEALRKMRQTRREQLEKAQEAYLAKMKRYSMEENEAKDLADEKRIEKEHEKTEKRRVEFLAKRDRRREIEARVGVVDFYRAYNIDMAIEPESKTSHGGEASDHNDSGGFSE